MIRNKEREKKLLLHLYYKQTYRYRYRRGGILYVYTRITIIIIIFFTGRQRYSSSHATRHVFSVLPSSSSPTPPQPAAPTPPLVELKANILTLLVCCTHGYILGNSITAEMRSGRSNINIRTWVFKVSDTRQVHVYIIYCTRIYYDRPSATSSCILCSLGYYIVCTCFVIIIIIYI